MEDAIKEFRSAAMGSWNGENGVEEIFDTIEVLMCTLKTKDAFINAVTIETEMEKKEVLNVINWFINELVYYGAPNEMFIAPEQALSLIKDIRIGRGEKK